MFDMLPDKYTYFLAAAVLLVIVGAWTLKLFLYDFSTAILRRVTNVSE